MNARKAFEKWISEAAIERSVARHPKYSPTATSWPGQYCDYPVQLAWEAWKEGRKELEKSMLEGARA